ncbi:MULTISPECIES: DUF192 domain-containing protein [unclassified Sphingomonas]|uniref:DUF192 domain-containing protein n=1 Tax=unclassified Sphingomonas TaxID=196159 RepID=UPI0006F1D476|nr:MULTISPECIES: DUF192 domain-containing protein [unclassified Sphingomonas]KQX21687.1 hypothetical protein ASD17_07005 [Sphingomonas sp. Root1294]KQY73002.1 hypothetical protein ASD39_00990 [Sphingomonas sp. Root50]KRB88200.1 hypothetical protein ASE22_22445 [Sphingomonas sp. Root720]
MVTPLRLLAILASVSIALAGCAPTSAGPPPGAGMQATVPLTIRTASGTRSYAVEVASTPQEQARGLMYRTSLPDHGGMIFPMVPPRDASFWMKNTYIPLDMIFIRADGTIARIAANTVPEDLTPVPSGEPVAAVLEIVGGGAAADGIAEGDVVEWKNR